MAFKAFKKDNTQMKLVEWLKLHKDRGHKPEHIIARDVELADEELRGFLCPECGDIYMFDRIVEGALHGIDLEV